MEETAMKWYMTVGVPGGDFAIRTDADSAEASLFPHVAEIFGDNTDFDCIRPCPPDLVEWIEAEMHVWLHVADGDRGEWTQRMKVENGWGYRVLERYSDDGYAWHPCIGWGVPVAGAAGLTVLGG